MMGSFLTRILIMALGYAYPGYECYKTVEKNKPEIEQLRFWCQYWILVALLTIFERVGDTFISWLPMYSEAKLAFFVYLWYPKTRGTLYIYGAFFQPYMVKHESEIDKNLDELKTRIGHFAANYWQKAVNYGQTRFFEVLQYVASQSQSSRPPPAQPRQTRQSHPTMVPALEPDAHHHQPRQPQAPTSRSPHNPVSNQSSEPIEPTGLSDPLISSSTVRFSEELSGSNVPNASQPNCDKANSSSHTSNGNGLKQAEITTEENNRTVNQVDGGDVTRPTRGRLRKSWLPVIF